MIFYGNIQIPRISGNFDACVGSVYQALFPCKKGSLESRPYSAMLAYLVKVITLTTPTYVSNIANEGLPCTKQNWPYLGNKNENQKSNS